LVDNIEKVFAEKANSVDVTAIDKRLDELREEMERLIRLNVKANLDADIYGEEYARITREMDELRQKRMSFTQAGFERKDALSRVREIEKMLRERDVVEEFEEELFTTLVEQIRVKSLVEVVFVLKAGVEVREILQ
jgi:rubrerythrin